MTQIFAHRGYSGKYPENTMLAFEAAAACGADGVELDVHLSRDGRLIVIHDERLERTTDGTGFVRDCTLTELKRLNASVGRGACPIQRIPTLEEYLELAADKRLMTNLELKTGVFDYPGLEEKVLEQVARFGLEDSVIYSSFHASTLLRLQRLDPSIECGLLNQDALLQPGSAVETLGFQGYHPHYLRLSKAIVRDMKRRGLKVRPYTPNAAPVLMWLMHMGVSAVITNEPVRAASLRRLLQKNERLTNTESVVK